MFIGRVRAVDHIVGHVVAHVHVDVHHYRRSVEAAVRCDVDVVEAPNAMSNGAVLDRLIDARISAVLPRRNG